VELNEAEHIKSADMHITLLMGWCRSTITEVIGGIRVRVEVGKLAERLVSGCAVIFADRTLAPTGPEYFDLLALW